MKNRATIKKNIARILALTLSLLLILDSVPASAANYRIAAEYYSFKDGKYFIEQSSSGDIVYNKKGEVVISPGRYCRAEYLAKDLFAVYKIQDGNNVNGMAMSSKELAYPYLYNAKKKKETAIQLKFEINNPALDVKIHPFVNGYAKVENSAFYAWTSMTYYQFIDKNGKSIMQEKPYSYCSDMVMVDDAYYFFTKGDELTMSSGQDRDSLRKITKRDITGKGLKTITLPEKSNYDCALIKDSSNYYLKVAITRDRKTTYKLYDINLNEVTDCSQDQIAGMKEYDPLGTKKSNGIGTIKNYRHAVEDGKRYLERDWVFITPASNNKLSFDVAAQSKDEGAWVILYDTATKAETIANSVYYQLDGPGINQAFMFEKIGTDDEGNGQYRIWAAHSGRQLTSAYDKANNVTRLVQGAYGDKNAKGKKINEQIFTVKENADGTIYIINCDGKYMTCSKTEASYPLVFEDFANGDIKQKFSAEGFSNGLVRNGESRY